MQRRWLAALALLPLPARAGCERVLRLPLNPTGRLALQSDEGVVGVLPSLFRELMRRSGCRVQMELVPRARLALMFAAGQDADLMIGTAPIAAALGADFVPLVRLRLSLITERRGPEAPPASLAELLERPHWRGLHVRGSATSPQVLEALARLEAQQRLLQVRDWATVLRMLLAGRAEFTLFSQALMEGETALMNEDTRRRLQALPLRDLPPYEVGVLLSPRLPTATRSLLRGHLETLARDGTVRSLLLQAYPADLVQQDFQFLG